MNEGTLFVLFGLGFDIFGAILIIEPLLTRFVRLDPHKQQGAAISEYRDKTLTEPDYERRSSKQAWIGLAFLAVGFVFQGIGNLLQNPLFD